jgi:hypothetical protein
MTGIGAHRMVFNSQRAHPCWAFRQLGYWAPKPGAQHGQHALSPLHVGLALFKTTLCFYAHCHPCCHSLLQLGHRGLDGIQIANVLHDAWRSV